MIPLLSTLPRVEVMTSNPILDLTVCRQAFMEAQEVEDPFAKSLPSRCSWVIVMLPLEEAEGEPKGKALQHQVDEPS